MPHRPKNLPIEVCILAGGLSARMGCDKTRLRIGRTTMITRISRDAETALKLHPRVIRKDLVPRCGPLGGIFTALRTSRARSILFLACDMPLVSPALLRRLARVARDGKRPVFVVQKGRVGFPFVLAIDSRRVVEAQIAARDFSLQSLAKKLRARRLRVPARSHELLNVNTPDDALRAKELTKL